MKKLALVLLVLVLATSLLVTGCGEDETTAPTTTSSSPTDTSSTPTTTQGEVFNLRWAHYATAQNDSSQPLIQAAADIKERTNGQCNIEIFWADSLIPMFELLDAVRLGSCEIASFPIGAFTTVEPIFNSAEYPFLYNTIEAQLEGQSALVDSYNEVIEEKFSQKALSVTSIIPLNIGNTERPIQTLEDWDGLMIQSISAVTSDLTTTFGATGAPASPIEVYELLQKGTVDGTIQSLGKYVEVLLWEVCPYLTNAMLVPASNMMTINVDVWNGLPKDIQDIITEEIDEMTDEVQEITRVTFYEYVERLSQELELYNLPKAERDRWIEAAQPVIDSIEAKMGESFTKKLLDSAAAANAKYPYPY